MNVPAAIRADVMLGTVYVPTFEFRHNLGRNSVPEFELQHGQLSSSVCVPPAFTPPRIQDKFRNRPLVDARMLSSSNLRRWILDFNTEMHQLGHADWRNLSHLPEAYPEKHIQGFLDLGFSAEVAHSFRYIRRGVYVKKSENTEDVVITDQNLAKDEASLRVIHNGVGVRIEAASDGVVQSDYSVLLRSQDFLKYFGFQNMDSNRRIHRQFAHYLTAAATIVFEDQFGVPVDLSKELELKESDIFPWSVASAQLYSMTNPDQHRQQIVDQDYVPEFVDQAHIEANVRGVKQRLVKVNWFNSGYDDYFEIQIHRPHLHGVLLGFNDQLTNKSQPVRNEFKTYVDQLQMNHEENTVIPVSYTELGLRFYAAS